MMSKTSIEATPGGREIIITRIFDAPPAKLWRAFTEPELVAQWLGPRRLTAKIDSWVVEPGGKWAMTHTGEDRVSHDFVGFFHLVESGKRLVRTFEYLGMPGHISLETTTFEPDGDKTKLTTVSVFQQPEDRDGMIESGMEEGVNEGNQRLDELLAKLG
jgi:uncharacterized protein YndB with AHSA1/START domain